MFARKVAGAQTKSADNAGAPQRSTRPARPFDTSPLRNVAWDFNKIPLLPPDRVQPKLKIGAVDDPHEREADQVADQAMRQTDVDAPPSSLPSIGQTAESSADASGIESRVVEHGLSGGGQPLSASLRAEMEPMFGFDFSRIRIHANSSASRSAERLSANAYALGPDIVFRSGAYAPGSADGKWLLAHELTHAAQQGAAAKFARSPSTRSASPTAPAAQLNSHGNSRVVRRDPVAGANPPAGNKAPDYSKMTWQQLLPHAHAAKAGNTITSIDLHCKDPKKEKKEGICTSGYGLAPTFGYRPGAIETEEALAKPKGGAADADFSAAQDQAISQIKTARTKIPARRIGRTDYNTAYEYRPQKDPAAKEYNDWVKSATPTNVSASSWNWKVFQRIQILEGGEGQFTTFDKTLSVGPGFSTSGGQAQKVIGKTFDLLPGVKSVAFDAGLNVDADGGMNVVDTDKKWILDSKDASAYLQTNVSLLSFLVNVSQGTQPVDAGAAVAPDQQGKQRQSLLDAEWAQFLKGTLSGLPDSIRSWPEDSAVLAIHAKHMSDSKFPYSFWTGPDLQTMVDAIYHKVRGDAKLIASGAKYSKYLAASEKAAEKAAEKTAEKPPEKASY